MKRMDDGDGDALDALVERIHGDPVPEAEEGEELPSLAAEELEIARGGPDGDSGAREGILRNVRLKVQLALGRRRIPLREALTLEPGVILDLDKGVGDPVEVLVGGVPIARGEVFVSDGRFCVRVTEIICGDEEGDER